MEEHKVKKEVWTMMDEWKGTKAGKVHSYLYCNKINMNLAYLVDMSEVLEALFY